MKIKILAHSGRPLIRASALAALSFISALALRAADPIPTVPIKAGATNDLAAAIALLDSGFQVEVKQGSDASKVIEGHWQLSGETRLILTHDLTILKSAIADLEATRQSLLKEQGLADLPPPILADGKTVNPDYAPYAIAHSAAIAVLSKKYDEACAVVLQLPLTRIKVDRLKVADGTNAIPIRILSSLDPLIDSAP